MPESVIFPQDSDAFRQSMSVYWAKQECEVVPACVVRPREIMELSTAVTILKRKYDELLKQASMEKPDGLFAIRSGGHSPVAGSATLAGGVIIDLSLFCQVTPSEDGSSVVIGSGARWRDVSKVLDSRGLAVVGGRNSAVGVGGFLLGGELLSSMWKRILDTLPSYNLHFDHQNSPLAVYAHFLSHSITNAKIQLS